MTPEEEMLRELERIMELAAGLAVAGKHEEASRMLIVANNLMLQLLLAIVGGVDVSSELPKELMH